MNSLRYIVTLYPTTLCNQSRSGARFTTISKSSFNKDILFPHRWECSNTLVVSCQSMNSRLNQNKTKLGILILTISLQMFPHSHSLYHPQCKPPSKFTRNSCGGGGVIPS